VFVADENDVPKGWQVPLVGVHNRYNVGIAIATARAFGVDEDSIRSAVENVQPVAGRLEHIRTLDGIAVYNDTNATTPDATIVALQALDSKNKKKVVLILGGADKELDMSGLPPVLQEHTKTCIFLQGTGTSSFLQKYAIEDAFVADSLPEAVEQARKIAEDGDVILFSPAFASFGMFKNEYDRGEQFVKIIQNLT
jgi:UDP-N-acetylmuramoylalanine--D-glutamate ligase